MSDNLADLANAGVSIWLDDLSRERIRSGNLESLIDDRSVVGVTTNPTIFAAALSEGDAYNEQLAQLKSDGADLATAITTLTTDDVRNACDLFASTYRATSGVDGRVSIEVEPGLAMDPEGTRAQARELHQIVDRPNLLVKIPATKPGLGAITETIAAGISVNVTLIFGLERYQEVMDAYMAGLEQALADGQDITDIQSVASFFVSRVDAEIDKRLDDIGTDEAKALKGKAAVANARAAYGLFLQMLESDRWKELAKKGGNAQRPLWASTGVKNPDYPDTMYVTDLVVAGTVNTMPEKTLDAVADHAEITGDTVTPNVESGQQVLADLERVGVDMADVVQVLEDEGVDKFVKSWEELEETVRSQLDAS